MYRLVLYVLIGLIGVATILSFFKLLAFSPISLLASAGFFLLICWAMNTILARVFHVPVNIESSYITALILTLIVDPAKTLSDFQFLGWAAILAMSSKYILSINKKHIFNPAAIAVVITAFVINGSASWWVGTLRMLPFALIGGLLVARKLRQVDMVVVCCVTVLISIAIATVLQGGNVLTALYQECVQSPLVFFTCIMLTEPLTAPPTKNLRRVYAVIAGILFIPPVHLFSVYSTPELALVIGNVFAYLVSPKQKVELRLSRKVRVAPDIFDFVFKPSQKLAFVPGQYMEFTLDHDHPDSRGNRRYFTLASSPTENNVHLGIRFVDQGSSFKEAMYKMDGRIKFMGAQIAGDFTLPRDPRKKLVFLAGGIGITPFRSMIKYLLDSRLQRDIVLIYAVKTVNDIVYHDVFSAAYAKLGIRVYYTLTDTSAVPANWNGLVGRINEEMIRSMVPDYHERMFYLSGPLDMVQGCEKSLRKLNLGFEQIKKDFFPGFV
jgi:ferredoxin-NADP reductase